MKRQNNILIPLLAISVVFLLGYNGFGWEKSLKDRGVAIEAWQVFENYVEFARMHNLAGIRSLSYQISDTCNNPTQEEECFALMDSVHAITSDFKISEFKNILSDERQIIMFTDGPVVAILYFTRGEDGVPKILGLRFCVEDDVESNSCVETDKNLLDENGNGWWDNLESLFY